MDRLAVLVDGFKLYHSLRLARTELRSAQGEGGTRWLDVLGLCNAATRGFDSGLEISKVRYFSALPFHLQSTDAEVIRRQTLYLECLKRTGVEVRLGLFRRRHDYCPSCERWRVRHEEKESDVALATSILECAMSRDYEAVGVLGGDSDLVPALAATKRLFPSTRLLLISPYGRVSRHLGRLADGTLRLSKEIYLRHQLPDPFPLSKRRAVHKPEGW